MRKFCLFMKPFRWMWLSHLKMMVLRYNRLCCDISLILEQKCNLPQGVVMFEFCKVSIWDPSLECVWQFPASFPLLLRVFLTLRCSVVSCIMRVKCVAKIFIKINYLGIHYKVIFGIYDIKYMFFVLLFYNNYFLCYNRLLSTSFLRVTMYIRTHTHKHSNPCAVASNYWLVYARTLL